MALCGWRFLSLLLFASVIFLAEIESIRCRRIYAQSPTSASDEGDAEAAVDDSAIRDFAAKLLADLYGLDLIWKDKHGSMREVRKDTESSQTSDEEKRFSEFLGGKRTILSPSAERARRLSAIADSMDGADYSKAPTTSEAGDNRRFSEFIQKYKRFSEFLGGK